MFEISCWLIISVKGWFYPQPIREEDLFAYLGSQKYSAWNSKRICERSSVIRVKRIRVIRCFALNQSEKRVFVCWLRIGKASNYCFEKLSLKYLQIRKYSSSFRFKCLIYGNILYPFPQKFNMSKIWFVEKITLC